MSFGKIIRVLYSRPKKFWEGGGIGKVIASLAAKLLAVYPNSGPTPYFYMGRLLRFGGQSTQAKQRFLQATEAEAKDRFALRNQAAAYQALNRPMEAIGCYEQYAYRYGGEYFAFSHIAYLYRQMSKPSALGRWQMVVRAWEKALAAKPGSAVGWSQLGEALLALECYEEARDALIKADKLGPSERRLRFMRAVGSRLFRIKRKLKKRTLSEKVVGGFTRRFVDATRSKHSLKLWYSLGRCSSFLDDPEKSQSYYEKAVSNSFSRNVQYGGIGALHVRYLNWQDAVSAYERRYAEHPELCKLPLKVGHIHRQLGWFDDAEKNYREALRAGADSAKCQYHLATVLEDKEQFVEAADYYRRVSFLTGQAWPRVYYRLGLVLSKIGLVSDACQAFANVNVNAQAQRWLKAKARDTSPNEEADDLTSSQTWWRTGRANLVVGDWTEAARHFQAALDREPHYCPIGQYWAGQALEEQQKFSQACNAYLGMFVDRDAAVSPRGSVLRHKAPSVPNSFVHYYNNMPLRDNTVLYESYDGNNISGNPRAIFQQRAWFDTEDNWLHIWVINSPEAIPEELKQLPNVIFIPSNSYRYAEFHATARYCINNASQSSYILTRAGQGRLNTWHGTPLKTLGRDDRTRRNSPGGIQRCFLQATHLISPNAHTTWAMLDRYNIRNIYTGQLAETGYPRADSTVAPRTEQSACLRQRLSLDENRPVILFAPTWRGTYADSSFNVARLDADLAAMHQVDAQLIFRGHHVVEQYIAEQSINCTTVPSDIDSNELLAIVDVLVTDYSSICVDFLPRQKPIIYYAYDQEEYAEERGFYILPEEMPGTFCREREGMVAALHEAVGAINAAPFNAPVCNYDLSRFNSHDDGEATRRTIDFFFHGDTSHVVHDEKTTRGHCNTLVWGGGIQPNGITSALRTLVHNLDRNRVNPVLAFQPGSIEGKPEREAAFAQFDNTLDVLPRVGPQRFTARESRYLGQAQRQQYAGLSPAQEKTLTAAARREFMRLTGHSRFDVVIDYTGYDVYWSRLFALAAQDARRVIYLHNDMRGEQYGKYFNLPATFNLYQRYDALVSVSASSGEVNRANLALAYNIAPSKFVAAENVFDAAAVRHRAQEALSAEDAALFEQRGPVFINIGRLSPEKDHAKLIRAFAAVAAQYESAQLLIMGEGPLRAELEQLIATLDMRNQVLLLGTRDNPMPLLARADCFVLSSNHEGLPVVIFEAMALEVPVISTDITGLRAALDNGGGQVVENTETGLRDAMHAFAACKLDMPPAPDLDKYRDKALSAFYDKVLALPDENNTENLVDDETGQTSTS